jgi:hypothetical protein
MTDPPLTVVEILSPTQGMASDRLLASHPGAQIWLRQVGSPERDSNP